MELKTKTRCKWSGILIMPHHKRGYVIVEILYTNIHTYIHPIKNDGMHLPLRKRKINHTKYVTMAIYIIKLLITT